MDFDRERMGALPCLDSSIVAHSVILIAAARANTIIFRRAGSSRCEVIDSQAAASSGTNGAAAVSWRLAAESSLLGSRYSDE